MYSVQSINVPTDGALSFSIRPEPGSTKPWWWYLDLNGDPLYLISNACGTCEAIFSRVSNLQTSLTPRELAEYLNEGLATIPNKIIETMRPLLPKGDYAIALITVPPTRIDKSQPQFLVGCEANYYWFRRFHQAPASSAYELLLPFVPEVALDQGRIAHYQSLMMQGKKPTALALSIVDERSPSGQAHEWAIAHFLLDGHHKVMAASQLGQPITLLTFLREANLPGQPYMDVKARAYLEGTIPWSA
jgi:hypothetical protein